MPCTRKPYNNVLGLDGKLKLEELECRHKNRLCLVCGSGNHCASECPASKWGCATELQSKGGDRIQEIRKLISDFSSIVLSRGCPEKGSAAAVIWLNSTSLSLNSFLLSLTSTSISKHACPFIALLGSGSSHCFIDELFAKKNKLLLSKLLSTIPLQLFDGSTRNSISHKTTILLTFSTGKTHWTEFYVTKLDKGYSIVISYDC